MANALDMSLDDLIKNNKQSGRGRGRGGGFRRGGFRGGGGSGFRGGRGRGGGGGGFSARRGGAVPVRSSAYTIAKSFNRAKGAAIWENGLFEESMNALGMQYGIETGTKLYVSNLDYGVSNDDMKQLFSEVGDLKRCSIHYDRSGRSKGTAEVVFARKTDALAAMQRYNGVQLDGKPMKIEIVGTNLTMPASTGTSRGRGRGGPMIRGPAGGMRRRGGASGGRGRGYGYRRGGGGGGVGRGRGLGRGRGRGRGRSQAPEKTAEELDKELEHYHAEAMQTS